MRDLCFDYLVRLDGDTVTIPVPHHTSRNNGPQRVEAPAVPVSYTHEVLVDLGIYETLRAGNARIGVSYAGERPQISDCSPERGCFEWMESHMGTRPFLSPGSF